MGFYDRDYMRSQGSGGPGVHGSAVTWLIVLNVGAFFLEFFHTGPRSAGFMLEWFTLDSQRVLHGEVWRLVSYAFLHDPSVWQHIVFNMLFLWLFGTDIEQIYGTREFLLFYLGAAFLGGVLFTAWSLVLFPGQTLLCIGASGAVTAVMVVYACRFPTRLIYVMLILPVPVWLFVVFQVGQDLLTFLSADSLRSPVAVVVHLAGAAFGFAYFKTQVRITDVMPSLRNWREQRSRPRLRVVRSDGEIAEAVAAVAAAQAQAPAVDEQLEAKVDAVLEKVARTGQASLTDSERQILLRASEIYKRKRT
jgi:membrane associated rhomboid family serine protease